MENQIKRIKVFIFCFSLLLFLILFRVVYCINNDAILLVESGDNSKTISRKLNELGAISTKSSFRYYFKIKSLFSSCKTIQTGEYKLYKSETFGSVYNKLCYGLSTNYTITIPEGLMTFQVVDLINKNKHLTGDNIYFKEEGVLLPETYTFKGGISKKSLLKTMQDDFRTFINEEWNKRDKQNCPFDNIDDVIILASIVEAEAKTNEERPIIASVYINRINKNMKLQADPTTIYEITKGKYKLDRLLTLKDIRLKGEFNTYEKYGLPKTPICNAGKKSILAVLHPAITDYLYFVAKEDLSGHYFAKTYEEHLKNIKLVRQKKSEKSE